MTGPKQAKPKKGFFGDWNLRGCARHGHVTYAPDEIDLRERLSVQTPGGQAWRCLRCWAYVPGEPMGSGPAEDAPEVPRGAAIRDRVIMRALSVERLLRALVLFSAAYGIFRFTRAKQGLTDAVSTVLPQLRPIAEQIGIDLDNSWIVHELNRVLGMDSGTLHLVELALIAYGVLQLIEAVGLWQMKRWGEYFAVVATSLFIPLEIYELFHHATALKVFALVINVAAVAWLVMSKKLFGYGGGLEAYEAERHEESLLSVEAAAVGTGVR